MSDVRDWERIVIEGGVEMDATDKEIEQADYLGDIYICDECSEFPRSVWHIKPDHQFKGVSG